MNWAFSPLSTTALFIIVKIAISNLAKTYNVCSCADCFIVIVDLELKDSMEKLEQIVTYIQNKCSDDKKIYVLWIYNKEDNKQSDLKEETIKEYLTTAKLNYDYSEICLDVTVELVKIIEDIIKESIEAKKELKKMQNEQNEDMSGSGAICVVF